MIKKKLLLLMFSLSALLLVGCQQVVDLTEEETRLIAEYVAELLLKYDINYEDRMADGYQKVDELATEELEQFINGEATTELKTEVSATTEIATEPSTTESSATEEYNSPADGTTENREEVSVGTESNIAVIAGVEGADITFRDYSIVDKYPATDEQGEFIYLEASEGYQLLVLKFDVVNKTNELLPISLIDLGLDYRVVCNGSNAAKPMLTILMDDLGTLETNVEPDIPQEAVLVFQVSDGMQQKLETMDLYVTYNNIDNMIKILQ